MENITKEMKRFKYGTVENKLYELLKADLNENFEESLYLAEEYYGSIEKINNSNDLTPKEEYFKERLLFLKCNFEAMNKLSLELLSKKLEEHKIENNEAI